METAPSLATLRPADTDDLIRVGARYDGGYVINERCLRTAKVLVGFGISSNWQFEADFQRLNPACHVIGVDGSVSTARLYIRGLRYYLKAIAWGAIARRDMFAKKWARAGHLIRLSREFAHFFAPGRNTFVRRFLGTRTSLRSVQWGTGRLGAAVALHGPGPLSVFVKMDVEGAEYTVLRDLLSDASRISGIAVEFHDCGERWTQLQQLLGDVEKDFVIAHVHGNNNRPLIEGTNVPRTLEVTFLNRAMLAGPPRPSTHEYPRGALDSPNEPKRPDFSLRF